ncbi:MAG: hypothetical protein KAJ81_02550, partial [Candidatus Latescibacteria bacterium]|nr:hypothetical protein [Candidatus Latescibacterota bacterium]
FIDLYDKLDFTIVEVKDNLIGDPVLLRESRESDQSNDFQTFNFGHAGTIKRMKGNKFLKENPGFEDVAEKRFQLSNDSPAYELGFQRIPIEKIGLYSDEHRKQL